MPADRGEARARHSGTACFNLKLLVQGLWNSRFQGGQWHGPCLRLMTLQHLDSRRGERAESETGAAPGKARPSKNDGKSTSRG